MSLDIERAKDELSELYFRQLEKGFPPGSMVMIKNYSCALAGMGEIDVADLMLEIRRGALYRLTMKRRLQRIA